MNSYGCGRFDVAQCLEQIKKTPLRLLELPTAAYRRNSLIPEQMLDKSLGGSDGWKRSIPDLKALLAADGFQAESIDVFGKWEGEEAKQLIHGRIDFAASLGAPTIVLGAGHDTEEQRRQYLYRLIRDAADYAAPKGVRIALEVHGGIMGSSTEMLRTMQEVSRKNVGVNFDTANILIYHPKADGAKELAAVAKHVTHVHLKDIRRDKASGKWVLPRLGKGEVDFRKVFDILHGVGFYGPFAFELETDHGVTISNDIREYHEDLLASIEHVRSLGEFDL
jgi:sugar phosphate isomerase/epimerase